ncbi:MAG: tRNA (guanosine(37)-N1)-methyltransferase TrmD [Oscillospiraceae bacterium]
MRIDLVTLFPEMCERVMDESILGRAQRAGKLMVFCHSIREYSVDKFKRVDDSPYGGGMGMLLQADPLANCCEAVMAMQPTRPHVIYLSPRGRVFTQQRAVELAQLDSLMLVCGHYEGVDQRFIDEIVDEELSIGDYVLTGGELAALAVADAVSRLCEGVLSSEECYTEESHYNGLLEYPHYTRPPVWRDRTIPEVLVSGHHAKIAQWRREQSLLLTRERRPDLFARLSLTKQDIKFLQSLEANEQVQSSVEPQDEVPVCGTEAK